MHRRRLDELDLDLYGEWEAARGIKGENAAKRRDGLRHLVEAVPGLADADPLSVAGHPSFPAGLASLPEWRHRHVRMALNAVPRFLADQEEMSRIHAFTFAEVFPGLGALGLAALRSGGRPAGALGIDPAVRDVRLRFLGRESLLPPDRDLRLSIAGGSPLLFLAQLPFSAFVSGAPTGDDPSVVAPVKEVAAVAGKAAAVLFRVDWTAGAELGQDLSGYEKLVSAAFPEHEVRSAVVPNSPYVHMDGHEGFIAAAKEWKGAFIPVHVPVASRRAFSSADLSVTFLKVDREKASRAKKFPSSPASRIGPDYANDPSAAVVRVNGGHRKLFPGEIASLLGFPPEVEVPTDPHAAYHFLGESVAVPVAERAVRGLLRAIRLD